MRKLCKKKGGGEGGCILRRGDDERQGGLRIWRERCEEEEMWKVMMKIQVYFFFSGRHTSAAARWTILDSRSRRIMR